MSVAVVTGGSRGVGLVVAQALAGHGFDVAIVARTGAELEKAATELRGSGVRVLAHAADTTQSEAVQGLAADVGAELGPVDVLVNNAGSAHAVGPAWEVDPDLWWGDVESSLRSAYLVTRAFLPAMIERGSGRIMNVSSYVGARPAPYMSGYAAAKAALASFGESLAAETAPHGVKVFTITPGRFPSSLLDGLTTSPEAKRWLPSAQNGREVEPERVAHLVAFLASGAGDGLSGRFLHALDDIEDLAARADEIEREDLFAIRLRRPPA